MSTMSTILDRYGIKEVADVTFYSIGANGKPEYPVLYLDTLKVSTIEQTGEQADARGGKGNPKLITWDYGKEITVTLEDALFSAKSMAIMFGDGVVRQINKTTTGDDVPSDGAALIMKTERFKVSTTYTDISALEASEEWKRTFDHGQNKYKKLHPKFFDETGNTVETFAENKDYFCTYDIAVEGGVIEISGDSFPGTYYITGDTYARSDITGNDEFFQFIIPKAKVTSENTITLEAEGDPSVFNMNLTVLRPTDGIMMKLVKYELSDLGKASGIDSASTATVYHNHNLYEE